jgi:hypothetical protein
MNMEYWRNDNVRGKSNYKDEQTVPEAVSSTTKPNTHWPGDNRTLGGERTAINPPGHVARSRISTDFI